MEASLGEEMYRRLPLGCVEVLGEIVELVKGQFGLK